MTTRHDSLALNEYYHIYNRGTEKRTIFYNDADYERFTELLFLSNSKEAVNVRNVRRTHESVFDFNRGDPLVYVGAYCLMPNHFHILLTPAVEDGIQTFMLKLSTGYSMYFNKRYERTGALYQGRFKSRHAYTDEYLKYLFAYIHLNPVKLIQSDWKESGIKDVEKVKQYLNTYQYSSFKDYRDPRKKSVVIHPENFPGYFDGRVEMDAELIEWLTYKDIAEELRVEIPRVTLGKIA